MRPALEKAMLEQQQQIVTDELRRYREESVRIFAEAKATNSGGAATFTFTPGLFLSSPVISLVVEAAGPREYVAEVSAVDEAGCTVRVRRSRALPAVIADVTDLQNFDPWEASGVCIVHLTATSAA
jgi:hypothetical protein